MKSAYLQGVQDGSRLAKIYVRPPRDPLAVRAISEWQNKDCVYEVLSGIYGRVDAPRLWFLKVKKRYLQSGWRQHSLAPCVFLYRQHDRLIGIVGIHADDGLMGFDDSPAGMALTDVKKMLDWRGTWREDEIVDCGRRIKYNREMGDITLDQEHYITELEFPSLRKHDSGLKLASDPGLVTDYRSGIGSLQWVAGMTRPDMAADVSLLQDSFEKMTVKDLAEVNRCVRYLRATVTANIKVCRLDLANLVIASFSDASWANAPGMRSQARLLVMAADILAGDRQHPGYILELKSHRLRRVCRSKLSAEAAHADMARGHSELVAMTLSEMLFVDLTATPSPEPRVKLTPITDCKSLFDSARKPTGTCEDKRTQIDIVRIRQNCASGMIWAPTTLQRADALTKRDPKLRNEFRAFIHNSVVTLKEA